MKMEIGPELHISQGIIFQVTSLHLKINPVVKEKKRKKHGGEEVEGDRRRGHVREVGLQHTIWVFPMICAGTSG